MEYVSAPCPTCEGSGTVRRLQTVKKPPPTNDELFEAILTYEETDHLPGCDIGPIAYCLDCHSGVYDVREQLRSRGVNQYPEHLRERAEAARPSSATPAPSAD